MSILQAVYLLAILATFCLGVYKAVKSHQVKAALDATQVALKERTWYKDELNKLRKEYSKISLEYIGLRNFKTRFQQFINSTKKKA